MDNWNWDGSAWIVSIGDFNNPEYYDWILKRNLEDAVSEFMKRKDDEPSLVIRQIVKRYLWESL